MGQEERDGVEGKVCDSIIHNMQFNVNCQMNSEEGYLIKYLKFSEVQSEGGLRRRRRMQGGRRRSRGHGGIEKGR